MPRPDLTLVERLAALEQMQLVRRAADPEPTFIFKHALTQETTYQSLLKVTRADLHRHVAEVIEQLWPEQLDHNAAILAWHYELADVNDKAFHYAVRAGDVAARAFAHDEALMLYDRALHLASILVSQDTGRELRGEASSVYVHKGRVLEVMGNYPGAVENYRAMLVFAQGIGDEAVEADGLNRLVTAQVVLAGPTPETDRQLERVLAVGKRLGDSELIARALWNRGLVYRFTDPPRAADLFQQALALAEAGNLREIAAHVRLDLTLLMNLQGRSRQAGQYAQQALADFRALDLKPMIADALAHMAYYAYGHAETAAARAFADEGLTISQAIENPWGTLFNLVHLLVIELHAGHLEGALDGSAQELPTARQLGYPYFILMCYLILTRACLELNQLGRAQAWADEAAQMFGAAKDFFAPWAQWLQAMVLIKRGELGPARALLAPVIQANQFPLATYDQYGWVSQTLVELALRDKRLDEGLELCDRLIRGFEQEERTALAGAIYYWRACIHQARGDVARAEQDAARALAALERAGIRILLWRAQALLADIYEGQGKDTAALDLRARAHAVIEYIAEHTPFELREPFLRATLL